MPFDIAILIAVSIIQRPWINLDTGEICSTFLTY